MAEMRTISVELRVQVELPAPTQVPVISNPDLLEDLPQDLLSIDLHYHSLRRIADEDLRR
jgi:hypothetical protein